jgi:hypothetical protein
MKDRCNTRHWLVGLLVLVALVPVFAACGSTAARVVRPLCAGGRITAASVEGSGIRKLTHPQPWRTDGWPTVSPDSTEIAFVRHSHGPRIYVMNADGTGVRRVGPGDLPVWSPDGRWLAASTPTQQVYVMKADGTSARLIGRGWRPVWSPDGEWLAARRGPPVDEDVVPARPQALLATDEGPHQVERGAPGRCDVAGHEHPRDGGEGDWLGGPKADVVRHDR